MRIECVIVCVVCVAKIVPFDGAGMFIKLPIFVVLVSLTRRNDVAAGTVAVAFKSESSWSTATVPPTVTPAAAPRVARSALPAPEIEPPELTESEM
jgi:hypothetical protein